MREELTFETIITGYGLTETCGIATMCRYDDDPETIANTSGRAIPGVEVRVVDDDGHEVRAASPAKCWCAATTSCAAIWTSPRRRRASIDADGWLHTGDVGVMDERGYLRITDRTKDMFIVGGFNVVSGRDREPVPARTTKVAQVAVVGVPDERMGEVGMAFVVLRPAPSATRRRARRVGARAEMANYKAPRHVEIVDELPLNATGKVLKYELRDRLRS